MAAATLPPVQAPPLETSTGTPARKRFTRQDVERMDAAGVFEGQRYELIDGDLIDKMGQKPPHPFSIHLIFDWLAGFLGTSRVRAQSPIEAAAADQERCLPEPDIAALVERKADYRKRHPRGDELLLIVEVSDSTVAFDLSRKLTLYAKAGVREYWVLDLTRRILIVHRQPEGSLYRITQVFNETDSVSLEGRTETLKVSDIL